MSFPKTLGACIDKLYELRQRRHEIEKHAEKIADSEKQLEEHIINSFGKGDIDGARGKRAVAGLNQTTVPSVKDWDSLYKYIKRTDAWDLLQRRVSASAYRERLDAKAVVPGVESFIVTKLSLRKR